MEESPAPATNREKYGLLFTELLYGVVIGNAIAKIVDFDVHQNILIYVALVVALDDYAFWHLEVENIAYEKWKKPLMFLVDTVILLTWYHIVVAAERDFILLFFLLTALFFGLTTLWELMFQSGTYWDRIREYNDLPLIVASVSICAVLVFRESIYAYFPSIRSLLEGNEAVFYSILFFIAFVAWKWRKWWHWAKSI